jgi:hypothetical protein
MTEHSSRTDEETTDDRLPQSVVEDLLDDDQRRELLSYLADHADPVVVEDLAEYVATDDAGASQADRQAAVDDARREIYDDHLPKLTATEVVEYDSMVGTVEPSNQWSSISGHIDDEA